MKSEKYDSLFSKQKDLQDNISYSEIKESVSVKVVEPKKSNKSIKLLIAFASLIIVVGITFGIIGSYQSKNKKYIEAEKYFEENKLDHDELSKQDMVDIKDDIESNSFFISKTIEVITKSILEKAMNIEVKTVSAEAAKSVWELWRQLREKQVQQAKEKKYDYTKDYDYDTHKFSTNINRYEKEEVVWTVKLDLDVFGSIELNDGILVTGYTKIQDETIGKAIKLSDSGELLWETVIGGYGSNYRLFSENNEVIIISLHTLGTNILSMVRINDKGEITYTKKINQMEKVFGGQKILKLDDYYVAFLNLESGYKLVRFDKDGNNIIIVEKKDNNAGYIYVDAEVYNDKLYVSGYSYVFSDEDNYFYGRGEISHLLNIFINSNLVGPDEEFTLKQIKQNYSAVLFVYNEEKEQLDYVNIVQGAIGNDLELQDDKMIWKVEDFVQAFYSPATSSFTFGGITSIINYVYKDKLLEIVDTDELLVFRR